MAVPADCKNCANDTKPYSPTATNQQFPSIPVILGVLGGLSLVALLVAVLVPLARRRLARHTSILTGISSYRTVRTTDIEDAVYLPSRRSSLLHQKMFPDPEKKPPRPLILDPLRSISAITWSDLRFSSSNPAASTDSEPDLVHHYPDDVPIHHNRPATSHRTMSRSTGSTGGAIENEARSSLPSLQRSPTPPGLPSKRGSQLAAARRASLPITPISPSDSSQSPSPYSPSVPVYTPALSSPSSSSSAMNYNPLSPVSPFIPANLSRNPSSSCSMMHTLHGMGPVPEDADADEYAETRSLQLPSPPASPDQDLRLRGTTSGYSRRPSLIDRQSAPNALPSRPRSSTGPRIALPLTTAFQTSVLRSGNGSSITGTSSVPHGQPYTSITTSRDSAREHSRPSSVSVSMSAATRPSPSPSHHRNDSMPRPTEAFRRLSTTDIRHRQPYSHTLHDDDPNTRASIHPADALRVSHVQEIGSGSSSHRHATVYNPPPPAGVHTARGVPYISPLPDPLSPLSPTPVPPSAAPRLTVNHSTGSRAPLPTVTWKSLASGSRPTLSSQLSHSAPRSRSNSVRSVRTLPGHLPPIDPVTPLSLSLEGSPENEEEETQN